MTSVTVEIPTGVDKHTAQRAAQRAIEQVAALGLVEKVLADSPTNPGPGHLAQAALREERWRQVETEWGMLTGQQVAALSGANPKSARDLTSNLRRRKGLTGVKRHGGLRYPGFQFVQVDDDHIAVAPAWTRLREALEPAGWSDADLLAWVSAPNAYLEGRSPADEVHENPMSLSVALGTAARRAIPDRRAPIRRA